MAYHNFYFAIKYFKEKGKDGFLNLKAFKDFLKKEKEKDIIIFGKNFVKDIQKGIHQIVLK